MRRSPFLLSLTALFAALVVGVTGALSTAAGAGAAATLGPAASASEVTVNTTYPMPATGTVPMAGRGFGHGTGMSQYGAEGAARQGRTWQQILAHYYPGTTLQSASGSIRVWISGDTDRFTEVVARSTLVVRNTTTNQTFTLPSNGTTRWRLSSASNGVSRIEFRNSNGNWQVWQTSAGTLEFYAGGNSIRLVVGGSEVPYRGALRSVIPTAGSPDRRTVNVLPLERYLYGVVAKEMPATWHPNAVRSQSVAARTYAVRQREAPLSPLYDICDTTSCQVYGGTAAEHDLSTAAVRATVGQILTHGGQPAFTQYSSSNGGWSAAHAQFGYMPAKQDPYDGWSGNPNHTWSLDLEVAKVKQAWPTIGDLKAIQIRTRDGNGEWGGRVLSVTVQGTSQNVTVTGHDFRMKLGLRSTWFTFESPSTGC